MPTNNRPVCLCFVFRRVIGVALTEELQEHYKNHHEFQYGYRKGTCTESAISFVLEKMRYGLRHAGLLDLRKALTASPVTSYNPYSTHASLQGSVLRADRYYGPCCYEL